MDAITNFLMPVTFTVTPMIGGFIGGIFVRKNIKGWYEVIINTYLVNFSLAIQKLK